MKRSVIALMTAACALMQASSELQAQTPDEPALKSGPHSDAHGGGCCCVGCAGPVATPSEITEKS